MTAQCLLAAMGHVPDSDEDEAKAMVGAIVLAEGLHELRLIRRLLTPKT